MFNAFLVHRPDPDPEWMNGAHCAPDLGVRYDTGQFLGARPLVGHIWI